LKPRTASQFDFGANWKAFSERALTPARVEQAKQHFAELLSGIDLRDRSFLDIGFGQGLSLLAATAMGANSVGCDINPLCAEVLLQNRTRYFPELAERAIPIVVGSILEDAVVESLRAKSAERLGRGYDIVYSWGVLHHTGDMQRALHNAGSLVASNGYLVLAIYARHWTSQAWSALKRFYNSVSPSIQRLLVALLTPVIYLAKWSVTQRNPLEQTRGMDFHYSVVDWLGGYPYEHATSDDLIRDVEALGFDIVRVIPAAVPTGCNQFVFKRADR
jgi:SAM-dependent methyltransferase